ncbi:MAG: hypothetical protein PUF30_02005 [bacterium]|nr:hypothetical protein [bacterium]
MLREKKESTTHPALAEVLSRRAFEWFLKESLPMLLTVVISNACRSSSVMADSRHK